MKRLIKSALLGIAIMMSVNFAFGQEIPVGNDGNDDAVYNGNVTDRARDFARITLIGVAGYTTGTATVHFYNPRPGVSMSITKPVTINSGNWSGDFVGNVIEFPDGVFPSLAYLSVDLWNGTSQCHVMYYGPNLGFYTFYGTDFKPGASGAFPPVPF